MPIAFADAMLAIAGRKGEGHTRVARGLGGGTASLSVEIDVEGREIERLFGNQRQRLVKIARRRSRFGETTLGPSRCPSLVTRALALSGAGG